ncbi:DUF3152 domain-containing protein [Streptomyces sp. SM1P]
MRRAAAGAAPGAPGRSPATGRGPAHPDHTAPPFPGTAPVPRPGRPPRRRPAASRRAERVRRLLRTSGHRRPAAGRGPSGLRPAGGPARRGRPGRTAAARRTAGAGPAPGVPGGLRRRRPRDRVRAVGREPGRPGRHRGSGARRTGRAPWLQGADVHGDRRRRGDHRARGRGGRTGRRGLRRPCRGRARRRGGAAGPRRRGLPLRRPPDPGAARAEARGQAPLVRGQDGAAVSARRRPEGDRRVRGGARTGEGPGKGQKHRYRIDVEKGLGLDAGLFAEAVQKTLNDDRSWAHNGAMTFERISSGQPDFVITLASPGTTGDWCAKSGLDTTVDNVSCDSASTDRVMINAYRWAQGAATFGPDKLLPYRQMLINHEVGHRLGYNHVSCRTPGALAPVMQQQTKTLELEGIKCKPNPWVHPEG